MFNKGCRPTGSDCGPADRKAAIFKAACDRVSRFVLKHTNSSVGIAFVPSASIAKRAFSEDAKAAFEKSGKMEQASGPSAISARMEGA